MLDKALSIIEEYSSLEKELAQRAEENNHAEVAKLGKKLSSQEHLVSLAREIVKNDESSKSAEEMKKDPELLEMAEAELLELKQQYEDLENKFKKALIPKDPNEGKNIVIEMRAGAGGDESCIFVGEMFRAYLRFAEKTGLKTEIISQSAGGVSGYKEVIFEIKGKTAFSNFKYEGGVHRVQRVPETEAKGRVHTSTITIAVIPEAEESDLKIENNDLRIDTFRSSGAGGQHVNTTDSAVRITHLPTNTVVECQSGRSQLSNKDKAMQILRSRLLQKIEEERDEKAGNVRKSMIGSGMRSEKIRTYNFPQDRITDHRIGQNFSNIKDIMEGNMEKLIEALKEAEEKELTGEV